MLNGWSFGIFRGGDFVVVEKEGVWMRGWERGLRDERMRGLNDGARGGEMWG